MDEPRERRVAAILARGLLRARQRDERLGVRNDACDAPTTTGRSTNDEDAPAHNAVNQTGEQE